jgi:hypothetical protein
MIGVISLVLCDDSPVMEYNRVPLVEGGGPLSLLAEAEIPRGMDEEKGEYDTPSEDEGECSDSTEGEEGEEGDEEEAGECAEGEGEEDDCDPTGLFDALAAAQVTRL